MYSDAQLGLFDRCLWTLICSEVFVNIRRASPLSPKHNHQSINSQIKQDQTCFIRSFVLVARLLQSNISNSCEPTKRRISYCVLHMWKANAGETPNSTVQTFSRLHIWVSVTVLTYIERRSLILTFTTTDNVDLSNLLVHALWGKPK